MEEKGASLARREQVSREGKTVATSLQARESANKVIRATSCTCHFLPFLVLTHHPSLSYLLL